MIVKVCEKHEVELWAGEECEICALRTRVEALQKAHENLKRIASKFAARVQERCPSWFTEEPHSTDFAEADNELRAALAPDAEKEG